MKEQIEEMRKDLIEIFDEEYEKRRLITSQNTAEKMTDKGYRKQEWISVGERLPEPNAHVLIHAFFHNQWQIVKGWHSCCDKQFHIVNSDYPSLTDIPVTHWMPLPEAPKMKDEEITCLNCKHLMFSDMYGECSKRLKIVHPSDSCELAERR